MAVATYSKTGTKAATAAKLNKDVFGLEVKDHSLLHQAYLTHQANGRTRVASVLGRGEVRGGGRKPWKQKGTGRARHGSIRSPIWRGGGVTFGPSNNRNYSKQLNRKAKKTAVKQALSVAANAGTIKVIDDFVAKDGKTKHAAELMTKLDSTRSVVLVVDNKTDQNVRATNNLDFVKLVQANYLNVYDILNAHSVVFTKKALDVVDAWLADKESK
ncbi:TPA: 50S ribosomal protein L4 [Candidatus Saccharibacteria bacterium]|nr:50S ribosomal protein L4 [Candidatus Saccharibacteria bacterium]HIO87399.1 50S ribosomal protein L4 [Candidatus Saccharibacteria bacterium]